MNESTTRERAWENPWFMAAFFCVALAVGLLVQSAQIDADANSRIEQLVPSAAAVHTPGGPLSAAG